jgi:DNA (cytosine-5)-methyltransferase 1
MAMVTYESKLTVHLASEALGVSSDTIRRWHKKGLIKASKGDAGERLFDLAEIQRLKEKLQSRSETWEVLQAEKSEITLIELFAGAGGLALGLHNAGLNSELLVDFDKNAVATLKRNRPTWNAVCDSVQNLDLSSYAGKIDVMAGGFPCQAFSYAGNKMGFEDTRGTLFYEFARLIRQVKPKLVLGENVKGLLTHDHGKTLATMVSVLTDLGYDVKFKVLRSQFFDVPQKRERLIIIGLRRDLKVDHIFPLEKDYTVPLYAALRDVPESDGAKYNPKKFAVMERVPEGGYWKDLPVELQKEYMGASFFLGGGKTGMARRLAMDEPSLTLTCNPAQKQTERCHPIETRPLTVREYARIQSFPDDWSFEGSLASQYKQIGNAVPVNLGYHVGLAIRAMLGQEATQAGKPALLERLGQVEQR